LSKTVLNSSVIIGLSNLGYLGKLPVIFKRILACEIEDAWALFYYDLFLFLCDFFFGALFYAKFSSQLLKFLPFYSKEPLFPDFRT
jgi:hypothetical protein